MSVRTVITDYSRCSDAEVDTKGSLVSKSLMNNPNFVWGNNEPEQLQTMSSNFHNLREIALTGNSQDITAKNLGRKVVVDFLRVLGKEVNRQAAGDVLKLQSSGFDLSKEPAKVGVLPKPEGLKVIAGDNQGEIIVSANACAQASMYLFFVAEVPAPASIKDFQVEISTSHKKKISNLTSGKKIEVKCAYKGAVDELVYSESAFIYVQ